MRMLGYVAATGIEVAANVPTTVALTGTSESAKSRARNCTTPGHGPTVGDSGVSQRWALVLGRPLLGDDANAGTSQP